MDKPTAAAAARIRAEASFGKPSGTAPALADLERAAVEAKTARLRELRLAKEKTEAIAAEVRRARRNLRAPSKPRP